MRKEKEKRKEQNGAEQWSLALSFPPTPRCPQNTMQSENNYAEKIKAIRKSSSPSLYLLFSAAPAALVATHMRLRCTRAGRTHTF